MSIFSQAAHNIRAANTAVNLQRELNGLGHSDGAATEYNPKVTCWKSIAMQGGQARSGDHAAPPSLLSHVSVYKLSIEKMLHSILLFPSQLSNGRHVIV